MGSAWDRLPALCAARALEREQALEKEQAEQAARMKAAAKAAAKAARTDRLARVLAVLIVGAIVWLWLLRGGYLDGGPWYPEGACYGWAPGFENGQRVECPAIPVAGRPFGAPWPSVAP